MKKLVITIIVNLLLESAYGQYILDEYHGYKKIAFDKDFVKFEYKSEKNVISEKGLTIFTMGNNISNGDYLVDIKDLIIEYNDIQYLLPYAKLLNERILVDCKIVKCVEDTPIWLISLTSIADGAVGPKYSRNRLYLLQYYKNIMFLTFIGLEYSNEGKIPNIEIREVKEKDITKYIVINNKRVFKNINGYYSADMLFYYYNDDYGYGYKNRVTVDLNLRKDPTLDAPIIKAIKAGSIVKVIDISNVSQEIDGILSPWYFIQYSEFDKALNKDVDINGWIFGAYLKY